MNPEERFERVERLMEFLADQQVRFFASLQAHQLEIEHHSEQIADLGNLLTRTARLMEHWARHTSERFMQLAEVQKQTEERFRQTDERFKKTDERFKHTDERLNALINTLERHLSDGERN